MNSFFYSVEQIPGDKARVAFLPATADVFRDPDVFEMTTCDGYKFVPWGHLNQLPYKIIDLIESDETLATCQVFNSEVCYGSGLRYCTEVASSHVAQDVDEFLMDNPLADYFLGVCQDMKYFNFAVSVIILNRDGTKVVQLHRKPACYCRFEPADKVTGKIPAVIFGPFRLTQPDDRFERIELLDPHAPWRDLQSRLASSKCRKFAVLSRFPGVDSTYYPIPHYAALFKGPWYNIKKLIGENKKAKLSNAAPIKYLIEVSERYWAKILSDKKAASPEEQKKAVADKKREMIEFLTDARNSGMVLFSSRSISVDGKNDVSDITVTPVDSKSKEGGDWESDIAEAVNMECFTMRVHSNLVGSVPGKAQMNNSGSDKRELFTIAHALQKPYRDVLFGVHNLIIKVNGWKGVHPDCPFIQLTTLDEHSDAREVSISQPQ